MPFSKGSLLLVDYTARVKDTNEVIDTTSEEEAKKHNIHDPNKVYEPRLVSVGDGWVLKGFDEILLGANLNEEMTVEIPPEKAFGVRDPNKVRLIPLRKLGDKADQVNVGDVIEIDNRVGIIRSISSGRVQIDFNHRLAGRTIEYRFKVLKCLEDDMEKATALIRRRMPVDASKLGLSLNSGTMEIMVPKEYYMQEGLQIIKRAIANDIFRYVQSVKSIRFIEVYERAEEVKGKEGGGEGEREGEGKGAGTEVEAEVEAEKRVQEVERVEEKGKEEKIQEGQDVQPQPQAQVQAESKVQG
ncbi:MULTISPECIES: peptidylprolyl isomerase [Candidatus Nitrosocaldus]|jgi:peptidylprolyl isomerase|uniref:Peptidyl-prolyl cis-trans isomerase n=1 Tax=Candidatus Nitrosocaldus cavascurensis TaxID=2058097 RepID=A0A2K5ATF2_9ARCH|nr:MULTISPECIES: peptidylprolyl isomerase [Candidatus Nitrosocaldus]SPC34922.1 Peptidyl-prolyl cis-trans isomerase [Candidatus Nitrosocaldus cavascurensis]